jgi:hypothetical protein
MQLQLLSVWRQIKEQDLANVAAPADKSEASPGDDEGVVLVELPFSSFRLTPAVAERLNLTESQKEAIQQVMTRGRHQMGPLIAQLRSIREKLLSFDPQHPSDSMRQTKGQLSASP